ncbi:transposase [Microvirga sp. BT689]|nr:transposase [Microvirga arvi]MBM6581858.1 transposase [Microvirga arvi]
MGVDADTGQIIASELTSSDAVDSSQVSPLLEQILGPLASLVGDGAYDQAGLYGTVAQRHPAAHVIVPPRSTAGPSEMAECALTQRDRHLQSIAEHGRMGWKKRSGYTRRALVGTAISRLTETAWVQLKYRRSWIGADSPARLWHSSRSPKPS